MIGKYVKYTDDAGELAWFLILAAKLNFLTISQHYATGFYHSVETMLLIIIFMKSSLC